MFVVFFYQSETDFVGWTIRVVPGTGLLKRVWVGSGRKIWARDNSTLRLDYNQCIPTRHKVTNLHEILLAQWLGQLHLYSEWSTVKHIPNATLRCSKLDLAATSFGPYMCFVGNYWIARQVLTLVFVWGQSTDCFFTSFYMLMYNSINHRNGTCLKWVETQGHQTWRTVWRRTPGKACWYTSK